MLSELLRLCWSFKFTLHQCVVGALCKVVVVVDVVVDKIGQDR